jgi:hypothetical protein
MRRKREIVFAFDSDNFKTALASLKESIDNRHGALVEIKAGKVGGFDVGIIVVEEDV